MAMRRLIPPDDGLDGHHPETPPGVAGSHASKYTEEDSNMKNTDFRIFTIPRANGCAPFKFAVHTLAEAQYRSRASVPMMKLSTIGL